MRVRLAAVAVGAMMVLAGCIADSDPDSASSGPVGSSVTAITIAISSSAGSSSTSSSSTSSSSTSSSSVGSSSAGSSVPANAAAGTTALGVLATLAVKGRAPKTGYQRDLFGEAWIDKVQVDGGHNGCRTREDILRRDLTDLLLKPGTGGCTVLTGVLLDPYTGSTIHFVRGQDTSALVQIDHVVALSDSWQKGAQQLAQSQRENLANDPLNLLAVDGKANQSKGAGDAATWLPMNKAVRCDYVARQVAVKAKYHLWVTEAEGAAIARVLRGCPGQLVPTDAQVAVPLLTG